MKMLKVLYSQEGFGSRSLIATLARGKHFEAFCWGSLFGLLGDITSSSNLASSLSIQLHAVLKHSKSSAVNPQTPLGALHSTFEKSKLKAPSAQDGPFCSMTIC